MMTPQVLFLIVIVAFFSVAQGLVCNFCQSIGRKHSNCEEIEAIECSMGLTHCIRLIMHKPAYGEVRRCASSQECEMNVPDMVERECCDVNFCN